MNIYLCGFMGCGKSTIGRRLASILGYSFVDLDSYIENQEGMKITEIFARFGEPHFRNLETQAISDFQKNSTVIATGGGALVSPTNAQLAKDNGKIILINASFEVCYSRISHDSTRPIAHSKTKEQLLELYNSRLPLYIQNSDIQIDGNNSPEQICQEIKKILPIA